MTWHIENGKKVKGGLAPFFKLADLSAGMHVQILDNYGRKLKKAVITRVHVITYTGSGSITPEDCTSSDGEPFSHACHWESYDTSPRWLRGCVHVRYRNGIQARVECGAFIRPTDSIVDRLASIVKEETT